MYQDQRGQFSLRLIQKCPVCNHEYTDNKIEILSETGQSFLAYLSCSFCSSSIIVRVLTMPHGLIGNAILTDLTGLEVMDYSGGAAILSDEVLALHELMVKDNASLFMEKLRES